MRWIWGLAAVGCAGGQDSAAPVEGEGCPDSVDLEVRRELFESNEAFRAWLDSGPIEGLGSSVYSAAWDRGDSGETLPSNYATREPESLVPSDTFFDAPGVEGRWTFDIQHVPAAYIDCAARHHRRVTVIIQLDDSDSGTTGPFVVEGIGMADMWMMEVYGTDGLLYVSSEASRSQVLDGDQVTTNNHFVDGKELVFTMLSADAVYLDPD